MRTVTASVSANWAPCSLSSARRDWAVWTVGGLLVVLGSLGLTLLSDRFIPAVAPEERPLLSYLLLYGLIGLGCLFGGGLGAARRRIMPLGLLLGVAFAARLCLAPSYPIQETDYNRYVLDGEYMIHGINPFRYTPSDTAQLAPEMIRQRLRDDPRARDIVANVNHPELPTIYPPLAQLSFAAGAALKPWDWHGQRWVFMGLDLATVLLLAWGLKRLALPTAWAAVYAWNPLILKEITNSCHLESLTSLTVVALCLMLVIDSRRPSTRGALAVGALLAAAVMSKIYPALLAPVCLGAMLRGPLRWRRAAWFCAAFAIVAGVLTAPFFTVGPERLTQSLRLYSQTWKGNGGAYLALKWLHPQSARLISFACPALVALGMAWKSLRVAEDRLAGSLITSFQAVLLSWFLFMPAGYPWYAASVIAVGALRPRPWVYLLSLAFSLYYLDIYMIYHKYPEVMMDWLRALEHGVVWAGLILGWLLSRRRLTEGPACVSA